MASLATCYILGNLSRDPESRVTPKGTAICAFSVAVNQDYKDASGTNHESVSFFDIESWGKQGESCQKYLTKGARVLVVGTLKQDTWEDKTSGQKRSKIKVVAQNVQFLSATKTAAPAGEFSEPPAAAQSPSASQPPCTAPAHTASDDSEIPF